jgi:hypothetical protein
MSSSTQNRSGSTHNGNQSTSGGLNGFSHHDDGDTRNKENVISESSEEDVISDSSDEDDISAIWIKVIT